MGLFDQILGGISAHDTEHAALYSEVGKLVDESGGVSGLTQQFEQKGMGGVIAGWIGTGPNPGVTGDQIVQVLGQDRVQAIAARAGLTPEQVSEGVSKLLPLVVDHLTPNGTVQDHSPAELESALGSLKSKLMGAA
jgi:uncharacterized protein YidB (DUF937 family)